MIPPKTLPVEAIELQSLPTPSEPSVASPRRPSETPSMLARRGIKLPSITLPSRPSAMRRPKPHPLQTFSPQSDGASQRSLRSVHFEAPPTFTTPFSDPTPQSETRLLPPANLAPRAKAKLFGRETNYRPLWLLALGNAGQCVFGSGEVVVQRAVWPSTEYQGLNDHGPTLIPGGSAGIGMAFGSARNGIIGGSILMGVGVGMSLTACSLFVRDGRRLNRRQNPANPNYTRTMGYFYAHLIGIVLLVGHRFAIETFRIYLPPRWAWVAAMPGAMGQAIFAVTQAQSFSSSEVYNGKMPLRHRGTISATARAGVSTYVLVAAIVGTPNFSAYWREAARLFAQTSTAVAYSLPLTTARLGVPPPQSPRHEFGAERYRGDWTALQIYFVYALSRMISMLAAYWLEHTRWPVKSDDKQHPAFSAGPSVDSWRHFPPPLPDAGPDWDGTACAVFALTGATVLGMYAFYQFRKDARNQAQGNTMFVLATACLVMGQIFRVMTENAKSHANFQRIWEAMPIGIVANAIAFVVIPEMFSRSEVTRGNSPIPYRYQVTEACRATGNLSFTLWAAMSGILGMPSLARMGMNWAGSVFSILGMALPDADTRRSQTGSLGTPQGEPRGWLDAHTR